MDTESGLSWFSYGMFALAGFVLLAKLRFLNTSVALPLGVDVDLPKTFFRHESPLQTTVSARINIRANMKHENMRENILENIRDAHRTEPETFVALIMLSRFEIGEH